ncbi:MAG: twin-arginine translocase TatA/TatE family subunit [Desulfobacteraceae bacterium]
MFGLGPTELIIIAIIVLLIFGAKRLPDVGKGLGGAIREFKNVKKELSSEPESQPKEEAGAKSSQPDKAPSTIEAKVANKVADHVPGVKKAMDVKKKTETIKKLLQ